MVTDKVTIEMLEQFSVGDSQAYTLPNWDKARSAASLAGQMKKQSQDLRVAVLGSNQPIC